jgi:predicted phage terminase large subunit-like protein
MVTAALTAIYRRRKKVELAPRGGAKSTWLTTILPSWLIARFPDLRVGLFSKTSTAAEDFSRGIMHTLAENQVHHDLFGMTASAEKWNAQEWLHNQSRWHGSNNVTLFANGIGGQTASKRFDLIICDDILTEENTGTVDQREKGWTWFQKTLLPCLSSDGTALVVGTRWAEDDLYERLIRPKDEDGSGWDSLVLKALIEDENEPSGFRSYWPSEFSVNQLLALREDMGSPLFSCAYQNDIAGLLQGNIFSGPFDHFDTLPENHKYSVKMGVDLASSEKERADYTARVTTAADACLACDRQGHFYILSAVRAKLAQGHAGFIADGWEANPNMDLIICESVQFQSTLVQEVIRDYPRIPIEGKKTDTDKTSRARAMAAKYEAHKVHHHSSLRGSWFETELLGFPKGHDDGVDSAGFSFDMGSGGLIFAIL